MLPLEVPSEGSSFYILPIKLPTLPSFSMQAIHHLYYRPDEPRIPDAATHRSLFLANIPFDTTETHLKHLFSSQLNLPAGRVEEVRFDGKTSESTLLGPVVPVSLSTESGKKRKRGAGAPQDKITKPENTWPKIWDRDLHASGSSAVLVFVDRASMGAAIKASRRASSSGKEIVWGQGIGDKVPHLGLERYQEHARRIRPPEDELLKSINEYMTIYAAREDARAKTLARQRSEADADGFITVTRGGRGGAARQEEAVEKLEKQKTRRNDLDDFYRFQSREKKKQKAQELIKKFQEDKEKVRLMKEQRGRFRPKRAF